MYSNTPLQYLNDISAWVSCVQNSKQLPGLIVNTAARMMQARASSLLLVDEDGQTLKFEITTGPKKNEIKKHELKIGQGIAGHVAKTGEPLIVKDVSKDKRWYKTISDDIAFKTKSIACSPLKISEDIIGVLQIIDRKDGQPFDDNDLNVLNVFANVCSKAINNARKVEEANRKNRELTDQIAKMHKIVGKSPGVKKAVSDGLKVADTRASVLILGESGTGKELMARMIHDQSSRKDFPLVILNCGALTESLLEDELFGHEKGAFTGASNLKKGKFELADNSTLFLDEIGEMSLNMQTRLLRVLQEGVYYRVGGSQNIKVDVRVISATNKDIEKEVENKNFREDLYYRLNVVQIKIPSLIERRTDILLLGNYFLEQFKKEQSRPDLQFSQKTLNILKTYSWPGNIRELKNAVERSVIMCDGPLISPEDLPFAVNRKDPESFREHDLKNAVIQFKKQLVIKTLESVQGNRTHAAKVLKIQRTYLSRLITDLKIQGI
ncbi:MAG: sigma-54-dependent Fis family transcriptional regulator [Deltaproteobacteria bacterium]|jgi:transcriptional regulator with GAF, ATPase, and Fis domain|nr:sigma-54-dependent Fis family transcriptional regulator [Deltaproteobacteria bacterium]